MWVVVGLGNPGKRYEKTRHNAGASFLKYAQTQEKNTASWSNKKEWEASTCEYYNNVGERALFVLPETFMNESGRSVGKILSYFRIPPEKLLVIHDDKDIPFGEIKMQYNRGAAGHNGIKSIIDTVGTQAFYRMRIGIGPKKAIEKDAVPDFVLSSFSFFERRALKEIYEKGLELMHSVLQQKI